MTLSNRISASLLGLVLACTVVACDSSRESTTADTQTPAATTEQADIDPSASASDDGTALELGPQTYQMRTFNGQDTAEATEEYLNSGYDVATYQLVLFDDGGGLLYTGRTVQGVRYRASRILVSGKKAKLTMAEDAITVVFDGNTMVFEPTGTPTESRSAPSFLAGRYNKLDDDGNVLDRLRLREGGTGGHLRAGATKRTKVFWGTDPIFGMNYLVIRGVLYEFDYQAVEGSDPQRYNLVVHDDHHTRFTSVRE